MSDVFKMSFNFLYLKILCEMLKLKYHKKRKGIFLKQTKKDNRLL